MQHEPPMEGKHPIPSALHPTCFPFESLALPPHSLLLHPSLSRPSVAHLPGTRSNCDLPSVYPHLCTLLPRALSLSGAPAAGGVLLARSHSDGGGSSSQWASQREHGSPRIPRGPAPPHTLLHPLAPQPSEQQRHERCRCSSSQHPVLSACRWHFRKIRCQCCWCCSRGGRQRASVSCAWTSQLHGLAPGSPPRALLPLPQRFRQAARGRAGCRDRGGSACVRQRRGRRGWERGRRRGKGEGRHGGAQHVHVVSVPLASFRAPVAAAAAARAAAGAAARAAAARGG